MPDRALLPCSMAFFRERLRDWLQRLEELIAASGTGNVGGPTPPVTLTTVARWANTDGTALDASLVTISAGGSISLPNGQTVDGRDVSVDGANLDSHIANVANPHAVTKTQVGLANVTNDAQLTRAANDWSGFSAKTTLVGADSFLIEDSAAGGAKKLATVNDLVSASSGNFSESVSAQASADQTTSSGTFADIPGVSAAPTLIAGDILLVQFLCAFAITGTPTTNAVQVRLVVDGTVVQTARQTVNVTDVISITGLYRATGLSAGSRTCKLQWAVETGITATYTNANGFHQAKIMVERVRA